MKMTPVEKRFVNSARHSSRVATRAVGQVSTADPRPGLRLLDVGCGNGAATIGLAQQLGLEAVGVDIDPGQTEAATTAAQGLSAVRFQTADATRLPFADGEFDLVYSSKTTHHVPEWSRALSEMVRVLKPGGRLIYFDFVAPFGKRLPTRRRLNRFAREHALETVQRSRSPFHYTATLRVPKPDG
jgi:ubiquinone/menaquinone biosynthesis C-methylase UbiE